MNDRAMTTDPLKLFAEWFDVASKSGIDKPHALALSTAASDGRPSSRMVLMSSFDERGFVFHTNYNSAKARDIAANPRVTLLFWWDALGRQVRIDGRAQQTSAAESDAYFARRPRGSQLGAWASDQSRVIASRAVLEERLRALEREYEGRAVPRPPHWGGYRVVPEVFEFWENRDNRLHHRLRFERAPSGEWRSVLLAP